MYLDELPNLQQEVGYGELGLRGALGYEDGRLACVATSTDHAISAHAPSCVIVRLDGRFTLFRCSVAIGDEVGARQSYADFTVLADGCVVAAMPNVAAGDAPREIVADITGVGEIALVVDAAHWEYSHTVWLNPMVADDNVKPQQAASDALARVAIDAFVKLPPATRCIATVTSPGYSDLLDDMLASLTANGRCDDALKVVFAVDIDDRCRHVASRHGAIAVPCQLRAPLTPATKSILYSAARFIDATQFLCLDADTLVLGDLRPLFETLTACPRGSILVCRDAFLTQGSLERELCRNYSGRVEDLAMLLGTTFGEGAYPLLVNDGVFAGSSGALLALDNLIRHLPNAVAWVNQYPDHSWRNQFIFNLAIARMRCGVELDPTYNLQVHVCDVRIQTTASGVMAWWRGRPVRILHFCGWGRDRYPECRGVFARKDPGFDVTRIDERVAAEATR